MTKGYEDFQSLDVVEDETGAPIGQALPHQRAGWQRLCAPPRSLYILLGLCAGLTVGTIVLAVSSSRLGAQQRGIQGALGDLNVSLATEMQGMHQRVHTLEEKLTQLAGSLDEAKENSIQAQQHLGEQLGVLRDSVTAMNCDLVELKSNGSRAGCCPRDWEQFARSCYWFSREQKTWEESSRYCIAQDSHLVIINSREEQLYVQRRSVPLYTWIGLTDTSGQWKWVDGTVYTMNSRDWRAGQPDEFYGHGLGGGEDCAHLHDDGLWNDEHCSRHYRWVCEEEIKG
ncbi:asialoglycoprotein receptor 1-like [Emydura macquarii macquarii]|uniref:asialoglycoprotein receptor 1-like n=1 Tax=Emydura macquarii macquarii TaxID=1129001 RepID=UPI00352ABFE7